MIVTAKVQLTLVLVSIIFFMGIIALSQIQQKKGTKTILLSQGKVVLAGSLFLIGMMFLDSYYYLSSSFIGYLFGLSPILVNPVSFEIFFIEKWFLILSIVVMSYLINLAFVYYTRWKYLFLTPVSTAMMTLILLYFMQFQKISLSSQLILLTTLIGLMMTLGPYLTSKFCGQDLEEGTTVGGFYYLNLWICMGGAMLFGRCETKTDDILNQFYYSKKLKRPWFIVVLIVTIISMLLLGISLMVGYDNQIRLIIFERFVVEGISLQVFNWLSLWIGLACFYVFYRLILQLYPDYLSFFKSILPQVHFATDWIYQFQNTASLAVIGFFCSYIASLITLMYLSFYQWEQVIMPNLLMIGAMGVVVAKIGDRLNGIKGTLMASFLNGILMTTFPTLSFYWIQNQQLDAAFGSLDYFFISQLLDILFIF